MKIILVGGAGTIGKHLTTEFSRRHEVIVAGRTSGAVKVDITDRSSIEAMFKQVGPFDALVSASGSGHVGPFDKMTEEDLYKGIRSKMMGQINLVMVGKEYINDRGSFTLTSGILSEDPIRMGAALSMVNSAVNGFVVGAAVELTRGLRINAVSPGMVEDSLESLGSFFPGHTPVPMASVVRGYVKSVEGPVNGQIIKVFA